MVMARKDRAVYAWLPSAPFQLLPWPEVQGVFYDDTDPVESPAWAYVWAKPEPLPAASISFPDARTSRAGTSQRGGGRGVHDAGLTLRPNVVRQRIPVERRQRRRQLEAGVRSRREHDEVMAICTRRTNEAEVILHRRREAEIALTRTRHNEELDRDAYASGFGDDDVDIPSGGGVARRFVKEDPVRCRLLDTVLRGFDAHAARCDARMQDPHGEGIGGRPRMGMSDDEKVHAATMGTGIATGIVRPPGEAGQDNADGDGFAELHAIAARCEAACQDPYGEDVGSRSHMTMSGDDAFGATADLARIEAGVVVPLRDGSLG